MDRAPTPRPVNGSPDINAGFQRAVELHRNGVPLDQASALGAAHGWSVGAPSTEPGSGSI